MGKKRKKENYQLKLNVYTPKPLPPAHAMITCLSVCPKLFIQAASKQHLRNHELKLFSTDNIITVQACSWVKNLCLNLTKLRPTLTLYLHTNAEIFKTEL